MLEYMTRDPITDFYDIKLSIFEYRCDECECVSVDYVKHFCHQCYSRENTQCGQSSIDVTQYLRHYDDDESLCCAKWDEDRILKIVLFSKENEALTHNMLGKLREIHPRPIVMGGLCEFVALED